MQSSTRVKPWLIRHGAVDAKLMERLSLDVFTLIRLRKEFHRQYDRKTHHEKVSMSEAGTIPRFALMMQAMHQVWTEEQWENWFRCTEYNRLDFDEMSRAEYPISPYLIRLMSALFGIELNFLLLGEAPAPARKQINIDAWPLGVTSR